MNQLYKYLFCHNPGKQDLYLNIYIYFQDWVLIVKARSVPGVFTCAIALGSTMGIAEWAGGFWGLDGALDSREDGARWRERIFSINQKMPLSELKHKLGLETP